MGIHPQRKRCDPPADPFLKHQTVTTTSTTTTTVDPHASKRKYVVNPERYWADQCIYYGYLSVVDLSRYSNDLQKAVRYLARTDDSRCTCGEIALPSGTDLTVTINNVASGNFIHKNEVSVNSEKQLFSSASVDFSHGSELKPNNIKLTASESFDAEVFNSDLERLPAGTRRLTGDPKLLLSKNLQFSILSPDQSVIATKSFSYDGELGMLDNIEFQSCDIIDKSIDLQNSFVILKVESICDDNHLACCPSLVQSVKVQKIGNGVVCNDKNPPSTPILAEDLTYTPVPPYCNSNRVKT